MRPFNPLAMENLAESIVHALHLQEPVPLALVPEFDGAGVYALYYHGKFPAYKVLADINAEKLIEPIYIGKASPSGARKGIELATQTTALTKRLKDHKKSIEAATNLEIEDFSARWLVMEDVWIALGESAMIRRHQPVWNARIDGFGNHAPGRGRAKGARPQWDTLHPGRTWAEALPPTTKSYEELNREVSDYLTSRLRSCTSS
ncbi:MAG: Eco29kI family restriction endonuclease [Actinomyces sp.]|jgi:hypothetical protein|nr:Eco29kI family restriction endonuclease [Actinomyces sp.]